MFLVLFPDKIRYVLIESLILIMISGCTLLFVHKFNPNYDVDRHYFQKNKAVYYVMKLCYILMTLSLAINVKYLITIIFKEVGFKLRKKLVSISRN